MSESLSVVSSDWHTSNDFHVLIILILISLDKWSAVVLSVLTMSSVLSVVSSGEFFFIILWLLWLSSVVSWSVVVEHSAHLLENSVESSEHSWLLLTNVGALENSWWETSSILNGVAGGWDSTSLAPRASLVLFAVRL